MNSFGVTLRGQVLNLDVSVGFFLVTVGKDLVSVLKWEWGSMPIRKIVLRLWPTRSKAFCDLWPAPIYQRPNYDLP
jgi:hypothetical protein